MKKLYYTIEHEFENIESMVANLKYVSVYRIFDNDIKLFFTLDVDYEDSSEEIIKEYLSDTYQDEYLKFELIRL